MTSSARSVSTPRRLLALLFLLAGTTLAQAQAKPAEDCPPAARGPSAEEQEAGWRQARDRGFLWKATKDGRSSYLYGTMHVGKLDWIFPGPTVHEALAASSLVALEIDLANPEITRRVQAAMGPKPGRSLTPRLSARLERQLQAACMPLELTRSMSPEMLGMALTVMSARRQGFDPAYGVDMAIAALGHRLGKPLTSLESPELQVKLLTSRSNQELREGMDKLLAALENGKAGPMLLRMAGIWEEGREDELARYTEWCDCVGSVRERAAMKALLNDRNPGLADAIAALHAEGKTVFAAVGSLHMVGPTGLPELLRNKGYAVERIPLAYRPD